MRKFRLSDVIVVGLVVLVACAPMPVSPSGEMSDETPVADAMMESHTPTLEVMPDEQPTAAAMMEDATAMAPDAEWMGLSLSNVVTGQQFRLSDYHGKVVLIEPMAVWCTKCRALQQEIRSVHQQLGAQAADLVTISIDVDPNEDEQYLKAYVEQVGHDWAFAIAPADLSRDLADVYGNQILNPPSTLLLIVDRAGAAQLLPFGPKSAADLLNALQPLLNAGV
jgi:cytochrome oxidase Cu insertion factor (SCO1/SenC/PrrC family)